MFLSTGNNQVAFFIGLFGSVHCVGMCGPLAFSIPSTRKYWWSLVADKVLYNLGRIITYSCLGLLLGYLGKLFWLAGLQQTVSIVSGLLIIILGATRLFKFKGNLGKPSSFPLFYRLINLAVKNKAGHLNIRYAEWFFTMRLCVCSAVWRAQHHLTGGCGAIHVLVWHGYLSANVYCYA
jgi:sulfite exporter TauE/SafE